MFATWSSESADVPEATVDKWNEKLVTLIQGYDPKDVYNMDKAGFF